MGKKNYGVSPLALMATSGNFNSLDEAVAYAKASEMDFVVEYSDQGKKILAWNYAFEGREALEERYLFDGDKRRILETSTDKQWLVLRKNRPYEIILPLSEVSNFERLDV